MSNVLKACLLAGVTLWTVQADARDTRLQLPIADALATADAKVKLSGDVRFFFGDEAPPAAARQIGEFTSSRKTNAFAKSDQAACEWAFLSALLSLRDRALLEGGDAVVAIRSVYKGGDLSSSTQYECGAGAIMAGVSLRGMVVDLD